MPFATPGGFIPISFQVGNAVLVSKNLATLGARIQTMEPVWEQIGEDLLGDFAENYASEGSWFASSGVGGRGGWSQWVPLAASTVADRLRLGYGGEHPILERTGQLRQTLTERGTPGNVFITAANGVQVGTLTPYAKYHQDGTGRMPPRELVGLTRTRQEAIMQRLADYVLMIARSQGLG